MSACDFSAFQKFDIGACLHQVAFGWVPDWAWMILPYWPWIVVIGGAGMAYRFAGWPGVAAFAGGVGFIVGRKSAAKPVEDPIEHIPENHPDGRMPRPQKPKVAVKHRPTVLTGLTDLFKPKD